MASPESSRPGRRPADARSPGCRTSPARTATAAAAVADEPDAGVSPAPRSQTSTRSSFGPTGSHELHVRALGEARGASRAQGPARADRLASARRAGRPHAGCRRATGTISTRRPSTSKACDRADRHLADVDLRVRPAEHARVDVPAPRRRSRPRRAPLSRRASMRRSGRRSRTSPPSTRPGSRSTTSACASSRAVTSSTPSRADARGAVAQAPHARGRERTGILPLDDEVGVAERVPLLEAHRSGGYRCASATISSATSPGRPLAVERDEPGDPPHPLPLVGRVAARSDDDRARAPPPARALRSRRGRAPSRRFARRGFPSAARTSVDDPALEHRLRPLAGSAARGRRSRPSSPQISVGRRVTPLQSRVLPGDQRAARLRQLERADEALPIVRVDRLGGRRVEPARAAVGGGTVGVHLALDPLRARAGSTPVAGRSRSASAARR